jgi:epoxide hydrolase-like predicted phosphatase
MTIDAVILDFGGVFTESPLPACEALAAEMGVAPGQIVEIMFGPQARDSDHPWHCLERGEITLEQARAEVLRFARTHHNLEVDIYQFFARMPQDAGLRSEMVDCVADLKRDGYATALLTNNIREFGDAWRSLLPVDDLFDLVVDSSQEGIRKPDPAIFQLTLERLGDLMPERTVFLDDFEANLAAASALGIKTVPVSRDLSLAIVQLDELLSRNTCRTA